MLDFRPLGMWAVHVMNMAFSVLLCAAAIEHINILLVCLLCLPVLYHHNNHNTIYIHFKAVLLIAHAINLSLNLSLDWTVTRR